MRRLTFLLPALLLVALAGCSRASGGTVADQGYISGDGTVATIAEADRDAPVRLSGRTLQGKPLDLRSTRGNVTVVNVWGSWCPPCIAEARDLEAVYEQFRAQGVQFVGINFQDNRAAALAHERRYGVRYPSIEDRDGRKLLALRGTLPPAAIPSTLVLDREGRVAARVLGQVSRTTLTGLVEDALAEGRP